ncbi:GNAT family N-acetyltransferase [Terriglobus aquaticus]|uniref:GNAT family N-acetyltransferase n=1 Tax=Terriglobus aquaticus TaxID=940139 RepID=A0ABW9KKX2_9BACT|nr:GNAT family N-acetyltransferase [Terriglobus aquaticus]
MSEVRPNALRTERLRTLDQFDHCVEIQRTTWGYSPDELFPRRAFLLAEKLGGHVLGAMHGDTIVAFNLAFPGYRDGHAYLHSQMLAVLPAYRNSGVGRTLKLAQRDIALADGFDLIEWTYDPLEIKNAFFNLHRLGAISRRYVRDFYGPSSSPLQGGLPTDRLYAEWWIRTAHVERALTAEHGTEAEGTVEVPAEIYAWKADRDARASATQIRIRQQLEHAFAKGLAAIDYLRGADGQGSFLLGRAPAETAFLKPTGVQL